MTNGENSGVVEDDDNFIDNGSFNIVKEELMDDEEKLEPLINIVEFESDLKAFSDVTEVQKGLISGKRKKFRCRNCRQPFVYKKVFENHSCIEYGQEDRKAEFYCSICNLNFTDEESFREHLKTGPGHKKEKKELICELCGARFTKKSRLQYHLNHSRAHQQPPNVSNTLLERPYECHYCSKRFASKYTIYRHIKRHFPSLRKQEIPIECQICGRSFKAARNLRRHVKIVHEGQKPYRCHLCSKQFTSANYLKVHIGHHEGLKNYPCKFCQNIYSDPGTVAGHMRRFHAEDYLEYKNNKKLVVCE